MAYTSKELQATAKITSRQMFYWYNHGWLNSYERMEDAGSGSPLEWSFESVRKATIMSRLTKVGFIPKRAHEIASAMLESDTYPWTGHIGQSISITIGGVT